MESFVIMPFSETTHTVEGNSISIKSEEWNHIYENWIKKAVESYPDKEIKCKRSETIQGNFVKGIIQDIYNSEIAIADLTGQKANVYYELGIRHSLRLGTIIITQDFNAVPSDLKSYYCFSYEYSDKSHLYSDYYAKFEKKLHEQINSVLNNLNNSDNPVSDYLDLKHYNQVQEKEKQSQVLLKITNHLQFHLWYVLAKFKAELQDKDICINKPKIFFTFLDFFYMDNTVSQLFNLEFEYFDPLKIEKIKNFYLNFRRDLFHIHQYWEGTRANMNASNIQKLMEMLENHLERKDELLQNLQTIINEIKLEMK